MIVLTLERFCYSEEMGTFGHLMLPGFRCHTVERPWLHNRPWVSCIPTGIYPLAETVFDPEDGNPETHDHDLATLEIMDVPSRSHIKIHPANHYKALYGCIGPGRDLGVVNGLWAVTESRRSFAAFWHAWQRWLTGPRGLAGRVKVGRDGRLFYVKDPNADLTQAANAKEFQIEIRNQVLRTSL